MRSNHIRLAVIAGSGAHNLLAQGRLRGEPGASVSTPFGPHQPIYRAVTPGGRPFWLLFRHGPHGYHLTAPFVPYRANVYALKELGTEQILTWSGPGAMRTDYRLGQLVLPHDLIDETRSRDRTFFVGKGWGFIRACPPFCPTLREHAAEVLQAMEVDCADEGVYVCTEGPRLETAAEIIKYRHLGGDLVGMTLAPEAFLARELEMCYLPLCYVSNYAEGVREVPYMVGRLFEGLLAPEEQEAVADGLHTVLEALHRTLERLSGTDRNCPCSQAMARYRLAGMIGDDWHTWISAPGSAEH